MKIDIYGRKMTVSESMAAYATRKVEKLGKFFGDEPAVQVTFSTERGMQTAEIAFEVRGMHFRAKERTSDMQASIDGAVASIDRQIQKNKTTSRDGQEKKLEKLFLTHLLTIGMNILLISIYQSLEKNI